MSDRPDAPKSCCTPSRDGVAAADPVLSIGPVAPRAPEVAYADRVELPGVRSGWAARTVM